MSGRAARAGPYPCVTRGGGEGLPAFGAPLREKIAAIHFAGLTHRTKYRMHGLLLPTSRPAPHKSALCATPALETRHRRTGAPAGQGTTRFGRARKSALQRVPDRL